MTILLGSLVAILLGMVSAFAFNLIGPCLELVVGDTAAKLGQSDSFANGLLSKLQSEINFLGFSSESMIIFLPLLLLGFVFLRAILSQWHWYLWENLGEHFCLTIRSQIVKRLLFQTASQSADFSSEKVAGMVSNDLRYVRDYIIRFYGGIPRESIQVLFYMASLYILSEELFTVFFLVVLPVIFLLQRLGKKLENRTNVVLGVFSTLAEWVQQRLLGVESIKHLHSEELEFGAFSKECFVLEGRQLRAARVKARGAPLGEFFGVIGLSVVCLLALRGVKDGLYTGGVLMSFLATLAIMAQSIGRLTRYYNSSREGMASWGRLKHAVQWEGSVRLALPCLEPHIGDRLINVRRLRYCVGGKDILRDINLELCAGKIYAICGPSGAGKSTLVRALLGLIEAKGGISFDSQLTRDNLVYVPQKLEIGVEDIGENLAFPDIEVSTSRLEKALDYHGLSDTLSSTALELSGGQIQRLLLARGDYRSVKWVVVDEATSALDPQHEANAIDRLKSWAQSGAVVIAVTHRASLLEVCDSIVFMVQGTVEMTGSLSSLSRNAIFRNFWRERGETPFS